MLLKDLHLGNAQETVDIRVTDGKFAQIASNLEPIPGEETVTDCAGKMVLPPFVESHVHLDTCLTAGRPAGTSPEPCLKASSAGRSTSPSSPSRR